MCTKTQIAAIQNQAKHKLEMVAIEMREYGQKMLKASTGSRLLNREMSAMGIFVDKKCWERALVVPSSPPFPHVQLLKPVAKD